MKSKQSIYIPFIRRSRPVGEHSVDLLRQVVKGRKSVTINNDGTIDIAVEVEVDPEVEETVVSEPVASPTWNSKTKKADLISIAEGLGIDVPSSATKAQIIELLEG